MMFGQKLLAVLPLITTGGFSVINDHAIYILKSIGMTVLSQSSSSYTDPSNGITFQGYSDPVHGVTYGAVFPPLATSGSNPTEFIGEIVAPLAAKWVGLALAGAMLQDLLLVAWPNGNTIVRSTRYATYVLVNLSFTTYLAFYLCSHTGIMFNQRE